MAKKLKAQLELDTSEARRKLRRDLEAAGGNAGGSGGASEGASRLSQSLDKAAASANKTAQSFNQTSGSAMRLTRGFAGIAVGLATSYAANYMPQGPARNGVDYVGSAVTGASAGAMLGPIGAVIGGLAGVLKTYMEKNSAIEKAANDFIKSDSRHEENWRWKKQLQDLSEIDPAPVGATKEEANKDQAAKVDERLAKVKEKAVQLFEQQNRLIISINEFLQDEETEQAAELQEQLAIVRSRKEQMESLQRSLEQRKKSLAREAEELALSKSVTPRASMTATDSLSKIGGIAAVANLAADAIPDAPAPSGASRSFGFSVAAGNYDSTEFGSRAEGLAEGAAAAIKTANERIEKIDSEQLQVLTEIKETLKNQGGVTWQ